MHYRFHSPNLGRFLSPDPIGVNEFNPQSWNRYSYTHGNPLKFLDPDDRTVVGFTGFLNKTGGITEAINALQQFEHVVGPARVFRHQDSLKGAAFLAANEHRGALNAVIGHSLGARAALLTARRLDKIGTSVDLLATVDAAPNFGIESVTPNVGLAINFHQPRGLGGTMLVPENPSKTRVLNVELRGVSHTGIDDFIAASIVAEILNLAAEMGEDFELEEGFQFIQGELIYVREWDREMIRTGRTRQTTLVSGYKSNRVNWLRSEPASIKSGAAVSS